MALNSMFQLIKLLGSKLNSNGFSSVAGQTDAASIAFIKQMQRDLKKENVLETPFSDLRVVVFDLETTGFYPHKGDRILSIGAVKMMGEQVLENEAFYSLVYSDQSLSDEIKKLTGIREQELKGASRIDQVLKEFYQFIKNDTLVAHHANHEKSFMQHITWSILKTNFQHRILDTSFLTKIVVPECRLVTLDECCEYFGLDIDPDKRHHALEDAIVTAKLWAQNIRLIQEKGFKNLHDVYSYLATLK